MGFSFFESPKLDRHAVRKWQYGVFSEEAFSNAGLLPPLLQ